MATIIYDVSSIKQSMPLDTDPSTEPGAVGTGSTGAGVVMTLVCGVFFSVSTAADMHCLLGLKRRILFRRHDWLGYSLLRVESRMNRHC